MIFTIKNKRLILNNISPNPPSAFQTNYKTTSSDDVKSKYPIIALEIISTDEPQEKSLKRKFEDKKIHIISNKKTIDSLNGPKEFTNSSGAIEKVNLINGVKEGKANITFTNGDIRTFSYVNGVREGPAVRTCANGIVNKHTYVNGVSHGPASRTFANGDIENFNIVNGAPQGQAIVTCANGDIKSYTLINGIPQGQAIHKFANGDLRNFTYANGVIQGPASFTYANGDIHHFTMENGVPQGPATRINANGDLQHAIYVNGIFQGEACRIFTNGVNIKLIYVNGILHGPASIFFPDRGTEDFTYENGVRSYRTKIMNDRRELTEDCLNQALNWVNDLHAFLSDEDLANSIGVIQFLQYINSKMGFDGIIGAHGNGCYVHGEGDPNFALAEDGIYFHFKDDKIESAKALNSLLVQYTASLEHLKTNEQKILFFSKQQGVCVEAKTATPFLYAGALSSTQTTLQPFFTIMSKYEEDAREALKDTAYTPRILAAYIVENHGGEQCIGQLPFLEGVITAETALEYILFSNAGDEADTVLDH